MSSRTRLYYVAGAVVLTVALYFAPGEVEKKPSVQPGTTDVKPADFDGMLNESKKTLQRQELDQVESLEQSARQSDGDTAVLCSLGRKWDQLGVPRISAHYFELVAQLQPGEKEWLNAAYRYFDAFKLSTDSVSRAMMVQKAIDCYKTVLAAHPGNLDAKTDLGVCYAEGTPNPMQGITLLREVVQEKPTHENAQFNLGVLSVKSGQLEKAVDRFNTVLQLNPSREDACFLLARCYTDLGQKQKAVELLNRLIKNSKNKELTDQSAALLSQINTNQ
jgi:tetratricopeptide (TPR) repeat protein